jgi:hypothetical protein
LEKHKARHGGVVDNFRYDYNKSFMKYPELLVRGCVLSLVLSLSGLATAQSSYLIRGVVVDSAAQEPLIGAVVRIAGADTETVADYNGRFALRVDTPAVSLVILYTGMVTKTVQLQLPLAEAIVIELGTDPHWATCVWVKPRLLNDPLPGYYAHPALAQRGRVPGLIVAQAGHDPWAVPELRAQGIHTLLQQAQPLWEIEGLPAVDPLLYDGMGLADVALLQSPVDLLPYGLQAGSGVLRAKVREPRDGAGGWEHRYRAQTTYASPQRLPEVASAEAYRKRWPDRADLGFATDWLPAVTRRSWSHDHHWQSWYAGKDWYVMGDMNYRNAQGVGRNSEWQQLGGRLLGYRSFFDDRLSIELQAVGNRRWGERDYHETFFQAAKYNPTAPVRFTEPPTDNVFLQGMYAFSQTSLNDFFEVVTSADIFNPVAMQAASRLVETRINQRVQARLRWDISEQSGLELRAASQGSDQLAGEENSVNAYFRGNATTLRSGAAGRWAWERRQEFVQAKLHYGWKTARASFRSEGSYRFQRFRFGNENSWGAGFADNDFSYENFESRLLENSLLGQYQNTETHRLIDFLLSNTYAHQAGLKWRTAFLYQGSTRLGSNHRWQPLAATDLEVQVGKLLQVRKLDELRMQLGYGLLGGLPQNQEAFQGQYSRGEELPPTDNSELRPERRRLFNLGLDWTGKHTIFKLLYQHSQSRDLIISELRTNPSGVTETRGLNLEEAMLVNGSLQGQFSYRRTLRGFTWQMDVSAMYIRTQLRTTEDAGSGTYFNESGYRVVETANLRTENGGLGIAVLQLDAPFGQLLGRQYDLPASQAAAAFVVAERFAGEALSSTSAYGVVGNGLPTTSWSWRHRLSSTRWVIDFQLRADLGHELAHLRRGELEYTIPQETIFPSSRNYLSTEYDLEGVVGFPTFTDYYVENANYLSLDYVSVSYQLHRKNRPFCTLSLAGQNLALWTNYTGVDPSPRFVDTGLEWNGNPAVLGAAGQLAPGIDRRAFYPRAMMVSVGVELVL